MSISIKTTSSHKGNLRTERIGNSDTQFFVCLAETFGTCLHQWWRNKHVVIYNFLTEIVNQILLFKWALFIPRTFQFVFLWNLKYKHSIRSFLEYCYKTVFVLCMIFCASLNGCLVHEKLARNFFRSEVYNNWLHLNLDRTLTDGLCKHK